MLLLALIVLLLAASPAQAAPDALPCRTALPAGPRVPAPIVFRSSCGGFRLDRDGHVTRLPARWFALHAGGTGRRYGADLRLERTRLGAYILSRKGRVVWRSSGLYRNDGGSVAFGPEMFAFAAYRTGIFLTDLRSPERLVLRGAGLYPLAFRRDGSLLVVDNGDSSILVVASDGSVLGRYRYRRQNGYQLDDRTEALFYVTPERRLVRVEGASIQTVRPLGDLDGWIGLSGSQLTLSDFAHRGSSDEIRFRVLRGDGALVSDWSWRSPRDTWIEYGPVASPNGHMFAFRTVTRNRRNPVVSIYVLRDGEMRPRAVLRHSGRQMGCGVGASFSWRGNSFLYSATDGPAAIVGSRNGSVLSLSGFTNRVPRGWPDERVTAHWLSDF